MENAAETGPPTPQPPDEHHSWNNTAARRIAELAEAHALNIAETRAFVRIATDGTASADSEAAATGAQPKETLDSLLALRGMGLIDHAGAAEQPSQQTPWYLTAPGELAAATLLSATPDERQPNPPELPDDVVLMLATALSEASSHPPDLKPNDR